jgi:hypothetical protein
MNSNNRLTGWICGTHDNIVWDVLGNCPICRAPLAPGSVLPEREPEMLKAAGLSRRSVMRIVYGFASAYLLWMWSRKANAEMIGHGGGMRGGGGMMGGMIGGDVRVPEKLPTPNSSEWIDRLREVLSLERLSLVQYQTDENKFRVYRPYMMVIPQEQDHIQWIMELFSAYGLPSAGPTPVIRRSQSLAQAYEIAMQLESDLTPRYEWLINNAEDAHTAGVLDSILAQTSMHYRMFSMAMSMGGMRGPGMR